MSSQKSLKLVFSKTFIISASTLVILVMLFTAYVHFRRVHSESIQKYAVNDSLTARKASDNAQAHVIDLAKLKAKLDSYRAGRSGDISIYFESLTDGKSLNDSTGKMYQAASLMKVPLVMQLYRSSEHKEVNLQDVYTLRPADLDKAYGTLWEKGSGYMLTLEQAANITIIQSDNTAARAINQYLIDKVNKEEDMGKILKLGTGIQLDKDEFLINPETYSVFLRCLYDSCFNSTADAQKILGLMTQTELSPLRAGVQSGVKVADKFGVFNLDNNTTVLNDCGIVYGPNGDYILCVMLTAPNEKAYQEHKDISALVYDIATQSN